MEKVKLLVSKLCVAVHRSSTESQPLSIAWSVAFIGAQEQLTDSSRVSEEKSLKKSFCTRFCGQNVDLDREEGAGVPTIARSLSCAPSFSMSVSARSLVWKERKSNLEKTAEEISSSGHPLFFFRYTARRLEMSLFSSMVSMIPIWRTILDHQISHFLCGVPCLFFGVHVCFSALQHWFSKKNWTRNIKNKRHALTSATHNLSSAMYC